MSDRSERAVTALLAAGAAGCVLVAAFVRPAPLPPADAARWVAAAGSAERAPVASFSIDTVSAGPALVAYTGRSVPVARGTQIVVAGWAIDPGSRRTADALLFRLDGGPWRPARYHRSRPDVATVLRLPEAGDSGFTVAVDTAGLRPGSHVLKLATVTAGKQTPVPAQIPLVVSGG